MDIYGGISTFDIKKISNPLRTGGPDQYDSDPDPDLMSQPFFSFQAS